MANITAALATSLIWHAILVKADLDLSLPLVAGDATVGCPHLAHLVAAMKLGNAQRAGGGDMRPVAAILAEGNCSILPLDKPVVLVRIGTESGMSVLLVATFKDGARVEYWVMETSLRNGS